MYLIPYIRSTRAISACLLIPNKPILAITVSELASVILPLFNKNNLSKAISVSIAILYNPNFSKYFIDKYININNIYKESEICFLLLFIMYYYLDNLTIY